MDTFFKPKKIKRIDTGKVHLMQCAMYHKDVEERNGYEYCEHCFRTSGMFSVHHIAFASEVPGHKELHNRKNLILLCWKCHNFFHNNKSIRNSLVEERGLNKLFGKNLIVYDKIKPIII